MGQLLLNKLRREKLSSNIGLVVIMALLLMTLLATPSALAMKTKEPETKSSHENSESKCDQAPNVPGLPANASAIEAAVSLTDGVASGESKVPGQANPPLPPRAVHEFVFDGGKGPLALTADERGLPETERQQKILRRAKAFCDFPFSLGPVVDGWKLVRG